MIFLSMMLFSVMTQARRVQVESGELENHEDVSTSGLKKWVFEQKFETSLNCKDDKGDPCKLRVDVKELPVMPGQSVSGTSLTLTSTDPTLNEQVGGRTMRLLGGYLTDDDASLAAAKIDGRALPTSGGLDSKNQWVVFDLPVRQGGGWFRYAFVKLVNKHPVQNSSAAAVLPKTKHLQLSLVPFDDSEYINNKEEGFVCKKDISDVRCCKLKNGECASNKGSRSACADTRGASCSGSRGSKCQCDDGHCWSPTSGNSGACVLPANVVEASSYYDDRKTLLEKIDQVPHTDTFTIAKYEIPVVE